MDRFDVVIVGAGVLGSALAREMARYKLQIAVLDRSTDVCSGVSKANSGVVHSGIYSKPGSLKARFCVEGNLRFDRLAQELDVPFKRVGKFVVSPNEEGIEELEKLKAVGEDNGVPGMQIMDSCQVRDADPNVECHKALWVPSAGITLPYKLTIAMAENACDNGVRFFLQSEVTNIKATKAGYRIKAHGKELVSTVVINCAGLHCRDLLALVEEPDFEIYPVRGEYLLIDKEHRDLVKTLVYPVPPKDRAVVGVHVTPTIDGPLLIGPSSEPIKDPDDTANTAQVMSMLLDEAQALVPRLPRRAVINGYSGVRCRHQPLEKGWIDYRIEESKQNSGFISLIGIESPGLTGATAIAKHVVKMAKRTLELELDPKFDPVRKDRSHFAAMNSRERASRIAKDAAWGRVICRCEHVTEAEVVEALDNNLGAKSVSAVKYRTRAGMGRCQGGFCTQHVVRIMEQKFGIRTTDITFKGTGSNMFSGPTRRKGGKDRA